MAARCEFVIDEDGWDIHSRLSAVQQALDVVKPSVREAETDIPWHNYDQWPPDVAKAASLLRERYVPQRKWTKNYLQTGVQAVDNKTLDAFVAFAPYAYDCTLWGSEREVASLADEGTSLVVFLTADESEQLRQALGPDRVYSVREWQERHPTTWQRLHRRLSRRSGS